MLRIDKNGTWSGLCDYLLEMEISYGDNKTGFERFDFCLEVVQDVLEFVMLDCNGLDEPEDSITIEDSRWGRLETFLIWKMASYNEEYSKDRFTWRYRSKVTMIKIIQWKIQWVLLDLRGDFVYEEYEEYKKNESNGPPEFSCYGSSSYY